MTMGATYCNLYFHGENVNIPEGKIPGKSRMLTGLNGWTILLCENNEWRKITRLTRFFSGDAMAFLCFDDDLFELSFYRNGKKAGCIDNGGQSSKLGVAGEMFPEDPKILKKLRTMKWCANIGESFTLLEETFGLPFEIVYETEEIPQAEKSDETWEKLKAREKEFRNRPNRFEAELLPAERWPESVKNPINQGQSKHYYSGKEFQEIICKDQNGKIQWIFAPELNGRQEQIHFYRTEGDTVLVMANYRRAEQNDRLWRLSDKDGSVLAEYILPDSAGSVHALYWNSCMGCYVLGIREQVILLDRDFKEIRRFHTDPNAWYNFYFFDKHYGYTQYHKYGDEDDLLRIDLNSGEQKLIELETPVYTDRVVLPGEIFCGLTFRGTVVDKIVFLDGNGRVISRNKIDFGPDEYYRTRIWEEEGKIYVGSFKTRGNEYEYVRVYLMKEK